MFVSSSVNAEKQPRGKKVDKSVKKRLSSKLLMTILTVNKRIPENKKTIRKKKGKSGNIHKI